MSPDVPHESAVSEVPPPADGERVLHDGWLEQCISSRQGPATEWVRGFATLTAYRLRWHAAPGTHAISELFLRTQQSSWDVADGACVTVTGDILLVSSDGDMRWLRAPFSNIQGWTSATNWVIARLPKPRPPSAELQASCKLQAVARGRAVRRILHQGPMELPPSRTSIAKCVNCIRPPG